jgi:hypothetical protein
MLSSSSAVRGRVHCCRYFLVAIASLLWLPLAQAAASEAAITGTPFTSTPANWYYLFQPVAAGQHSLTFSIMNLPAWATFSASTGRLFGRPTSANTGTYSNIVISASDGNSQTSLPAFSITVVPDLNAGSVISGGASPIVEIGQPYTFQPLVTDAAGEQVNLLIHGKPRWLVFDRSTAALSGTPGAGDVGQYGDIRLYAANPYSKIVSTPFTIIVGPPAPGTIGATTLFWSPPMENTDGSALIDLAGYRIYYGTTADSLNQVVDVADPGLSARVMGGLPPGTWYFAVTAYNASGVESDHSAIISMNF